MTSATFLPQLVPIAPRASGRKRAWFPSILGDHQSGLSLQNMQGTNKKEKIQWIRLSLLLRSALLTW